MSSSLNMRSWLVASAMALCVGLGAMLHAEPVDAIPAPMESAAHAAMLEPVSDSSDHRVSGQTIHRSADGMFYITGSIKGKAVRFLVDTGASITVLTADDAALLGNDLGAAQGESHLTTVGGQTEVRDASLDGLVIAGKRMPRIRVAVIDTSIDVSLLGQNVLSKLGPITFDMDVMTLR